MPIIGIQQQQTEVGRIRFGVKIKTGSGGRERPVKLDRLRFTSPRKALIERIAELYGGTVEPWQPPRGSQQWQVITNATEVPVLVPEQDPSQNQWYEMWSAGGCLRRCDGQKETISKSSCLCDPDERDCKMHTRLRVMLEDVPGLGAWRVDTGSYYAAVELPGIAALLAMAQGAIPGRLVLDQRTVTRQVNGKPQTFNFAVPVLHVEEITPGQLVSGKVHELVAARRAAAIAGEVRAAISAGPAVDYTRLIDAAKNEPALYELATKVKNEHGGEIPADLLPLFEAKRTAIRGAQPQSNQTPPTAPVETPAVVKNVDTLWEQILEASPWDDAEDLEKAFIELVGRSSADADAADMQRFLTAMEAAKVGAAA